MPDTASEAIPVQDLETLARGGDALAVRVWLRMLACSTMIENDIRSLVHGRFHTTLPRFDALAQLERAPDGLAMGELSRRMMVTNGNVTGLVARLVREGLVDRVENPSDRRASVVRLTAAGRAAFAAMTPVHHDRLEALFAGMGRVELEALLALLGNLKQSLHDGKRKNGDLHEDD